MNGISTLILDLDGTVYIDGKPIKDVVSKLMEFKRKENNIYYLSNNTTVSRKVYLNKLKSLGIEVSLEDIITPTIIAGEYISKQFKRGYLLGTQSFKQEMCEEFNVEHDEESPEFVMIAFDTELTYEKLKKACQLINMGLDYYITHIDLACPSNKGPIPDCGAISLLVQTVTGVYPKIDFGKPSKGMVSYIENNIIQGREKQSFLMAGDRIYTDIKLGLNLSINTLVVLSGETKLLDLNKIEPSDKPDYWAHTLADFLSGEYNLLSN